jgi:hypothetical protein
MNRWRVRAAPPVKWYVIIQAAFAAGVSQGIAVERTS